jgi:anti-anti-sigma factor
VERPFLTIESSSGADPVRVRLVGELDQASAPTFAERLTDLLPAGPSGIVIDLSELRFCDSQGLAAMARLHLACQAAGCRLVWTNTTEHVYRLLEISGLAAVLLLRDEPEHGRPTG